MITLNKTLITGTVATKPVTLYSANKVTCDFKFTFDNNTIEVKVKDGLARLCQVYLKKGDQITVTGKTKKSKDGQTIITAEKIHVKEVKL